LSMQPQSQQRQIMPQPKPNGSAVPSRPTVQVQNASDESSSESSSSGGDDDDSSDDFTLPRLLQGRVAHRHGRSRSRRLCTFLQRGVSSAADDLGSSLSPVVVDAHDVPKDPNGTRSSA
jgi:hypothetical protein